MLRISFYIVCSLLFLETGAQEGQPVFSYINQGELGSLNAYLTGHDINERYGLDSITLLSYAILTGHKKVVKCLLDHGADVGRCFMGDPPLVTAVRQDDLSLVRLLVKNGADPNATNAKGNSVLIHAVSRGRLPVIRFLVRSGALINYRNPEGTDARAMAIRSNYPLAADYLRKIYERHLPDMWDGPFITWKNKDRLESFYLVNDSVSRHTGKISKKMHAGSDPFTVCGFMDDSGSYTVTREPFTPIPEFKAARKIMVLGDVHGGYDSLVLFLYNNGVIDEENNWVWGKGHLVFLGDVFDRGHKVTEAFWLIYGLEREARAKGGCVHFVLGNHEIMEMTGNTSYLADKYKYLTGRTNTRYSWLFNKKTVLGKWMRTRNTVIRINDILFVHAGISPKLAASGLTIREINDMVRFLISHPGRHPFGWETEHLLLGSMGPLWYRGYLKPAAGYRKIREQEVNHVLETYGVRRMMIGHNYVRSVTPLYGGRVYCLDVPYYTMRSSIQGLLIVNGSISLLDSAGGQTPMQ